MNNHVDARRSRALIRGPIARFAALLLTAVLIGCVADSNLQPPDPQAPETQASEAAAEQPAPDSKGADTPLAKPEEPPVKPATEPPAKLVSAPPVQLLGMSRADIVRHLGKPAFQRRDRTALLLRYRGERCILDLYLYPGDQSAPGKAVDYFEARDDDGQLIDTEPCIDAVRKAKAAG